VIGGVISLGHNGHFMVSDKQGFLGYRLPVYVCSAIPERRRQGVQVIPKKDPGCIRSRKRYTHYRSHTLAMCCLATIFFLLNSNYVLASIVVNPRTPLPDRQTSCMTSPRHCHQKKDNTSRKGMQKRKHCAVRGSTISLLESCFEPSILLVLTPVIPT
jgi:hypothetical protein